MIIVPNRIHQCPKFKPIMKDQLQCIAVLISNDMIQRQQIPHLLVYELYDHNGIPLFDSPVYKKDRLPNAEVLCALARYYQQMKNRLVTNVNRTKYLFPHINSEVSIKRAFDKIGIGYTFIKRLGDPVDVGSTLYILISERNNI